MMPIIATCRTMPTRLSAVRKAGWAIEKTTAMASIARASA
jgi:hypothetical protein